jgi:hypothetical protein
MRTTHTVILTGILCSVVSTVRAQTATTLGPPVTPGSGTPPTPAGQAWLVGVLIGVEVIVLLAVIAKVIDLTRQPEDKAVQLQAQISDALLRDRALVSLLVAATVHVPLWRQSGRPSRCTDRSRRAIFARPSRV